MKKLLLPLYFKYRFTRYFIKFYKPIGVLNLIWCYLNGFFPRNYILFDLKNKDPKLFITDYEENFKISRINKNPQVLNDKLLFPEIIGSFFKTPKILALIYQGKFIPYKPESKFVESEALYYLKQNQSLILKPIDGDGGIGIVKVSWNEDQSKYNWNGELISENDLRNRWKKLNNYLVSDFVTQGEYSKKLFSDAVNTVRVVSMIDPMTGNPFIALAAHRIGNLKSAPVDNCAMGGFTAPIDIPTGQLGIASATKFEGIVKPNYPQHPDSGSPIQGVVIPHWEQLKEEICLLHNRLNYISYIGWDIVHGDDGRFYLLEGNDQVDLKLHQAHQPLLVDEQIKRFYTHHLVINR